MAVRTGAAIPFGKMYADHELSDYSSVQVPFVVDIGGKPIPELFIGGYIGIAVGGSAEKKVDLGGTRDSGYLRFGWRAGVEGQYHFIPGGDINPWVGYGFGWEAVGLGTIQGSPWAAVLAGYEFAHLMGGADFRLTRIVGVGPFVDVSFGRYTDSDRNELDDADHATHGWAIFGVRAVFVP